MMTKKLHDSAYPIATELRKHFAADFDSKDSIGRRYRRHDEIGTPFCVTYDFDSEQDKKITVRNRDTMQQDRVSIDQLQRYLSDAIHSSI